MQVHNRSELKKAVLGNVDIIEIVNPHLARQIEALVAGGKHCTSSTTVPVAGIPSKAYAMLLPPLWPVIALLGLLFLGAAVFYALEHHYEMTVWQGPDGMPFVTLKKRATDEGPAGNVSEEAGVES